MSLNLNAHEIDLICESFNRLLMQGDQAVYLFYNRLFTIAPETALLFRSNPADQRAKFIQMIGQVVHLLNEPDELPLLLSQLGKRHKGYNVSPEQYDIVGTALIWMLEQTLETGFTTEVRAAWTKLYTFMAETAKAAV